MFLSNVPLHQNFGNLSYQNTCPVPWPVENDSLSERINFNAIVSNPLSASTNAFEKEIRALEAIKIDPVSDLMKNKRLEDFNRLLDKIVQKPLPFNKFLGDIHKKTNLFKNFLSSVFNESTAFKKFFKATFESKDFNLFRNSLNVIFKENVILKSFLNVVSKESAILKNYFNIVVPEKKDAVPKEKDKTVKSNSPITPLKKSSSPYKYFELNANDLGLQVDKSWLKEVDECISNPKLVALQSEGMSGSYLIKNKANKPIAIFKPDAQITGQKNDHKVMHGSIKEYIVRLIGGDFFSIPELCLIKVRLNGRLQAGSLQKYIMHDGNAKDLFRKAIELIDSIKPEFFEKLANAPFWYLRGHLLLALQNSQNENPTVRKMASSFQKLAVLDMLIQNSDRHNPTNLLYKQNDDQLEIFSIDHTLVFPPDIIVLDPDVIWSNQPALKMPMDADVTAFLRDLDVNKIANEMRKVGMSQAQIGAFKIMGILLKCAADNKIPLYDLVVLLEPRAHLPFEKSLFYQFFFRQMIDISSEKKLKLNQILEGTDLYSNVKTKLTQIFKAYKYHPLDEVTSVSYWSKLLDSPLPPIEKISNEPLNVIIELMESHLPRERVPLRKK